MLRSVVLETAWVLSSGYQLSRERVAERIRHILRLPRVFTEDVDNLLLALDWYEQGMDFADALHVSAAQDASDGFATFDKGIAKAVKRIHIRFPILSPLPHDPLQPCSYRSHAPAWERLAGALRPDRTGLR